MAWRPDQSLIRGEIDNTQRGLVTGTLWFLGREEPVQLHLTGDAAPDLAGCRLTFVNPDPQPETADFSSFLSLQTGQAGDITAANKRKDFNLSPDAFDLAYRENRVHELPYQWSNSLYLEWFSSANGRVLIESCRYQLSVSEPAWTSDADDQAAQEWLALSAMRDYLDAVVNRSDPARAKMPDEMSEEDWEAALKESDRLTDAAMEAAEKFDGDPSALDKEAFVMGWDRLAAAGPDEYADQRETCESFTPDDSERTAEDYAEVYDDDDDDEEGDWERTTPPLCVSARLLSRQAISFIRTAQLEESKSGKSPADRLLVPILQTNGKLGGALSRHGKDDPGQPRTYILAITRRCLNWLNEALASLQEIESNFTPQTTSAARQQSAELTAGIHALRLAVSDLRHELTHGRSPGDSSAGF